MIFLLLLLLLPIPLLPPEVDVLGAFISHTPAIFVPSVLCLSHIFRIESFSYFFISY